MGGRQALPLGHSLVSVVHVHVHVHVHGVGLAK